MLNTGKSGENWEFRSMPLGVEHKVRSVWKSRSEDTSPADDWRTYSNFRNHRSFCLDVFDIDGDGKLELLCCHVQHIPGPVIEVWRNIGSLDKPVMLYEDILPWSRSYTTFSLRFVNNEAFDGCLWATFNSGSGIRYFKRVKQDYTDPEAYRNMGPLLGEGCKLKVEGYCRPSPIRITPESGVSLVCGDEPGFITLARNIGTKKRSAFALPGPISDQTGEILRLNRESIIPDNDGERNTGQVKPFVCDWDGDGNMDLVVGGNTNRIFWLEQYDPETNTYLRIHRLVVKDSYNPFASRKGPAVYDIHGRGKPDLIAVDSELRICVFRQGTGARGLIELEPGVPLLYIDGAPITTESIGPPPFKSPNICIAVCDWTHTGKHDLIISSNEQTFILKNRGTNEKPRFERPKTLEEPDGTAVVTSHHESHVAAFDWDGDGRLDLMIGGEAGTIYLFHRDWVSGLMQKVSLGGLEVILPSRRL
jgi:hypothetical protein